jgi:hypothetical protein
MNPRRTPAPPSRSRTRGPTTVADDPAGRWVVVLAILCAVCTAHRAWSRGQAAARRGPCVDVPGLRTAPPPLECSCFRDPRNGEACYDEVALGNCESADCLGISGPCTLVPMTCTKLARRRCSGGRGCSGDAECEDLGIEFVGRTVMRCR